MHPPAPLEPYKYSNSSQQVPRTLATAREINEMPLSSKPRAHAAYRQWELCKASFPSSSPWMASAPWEGQGAPPVSSHSSNLHQSTWAATPHLIQQILLMMEWYERTKKRRGMEVSVLTMTSANGWGRTTEVQVRFAFEPFIRDINLLISYAKSANKLCSDTSPKSKAATQQSASAPS